MSKTPSRSHRFSLSLWVAAFAMACGAPSPTDPVVDDAATVDDDGGSPSIPDATTPGDDAATLADGTTPMPDGSVTVPDTLLFFDDFEYEVARDVAGASEGFRAHGWAGAKTQQDGSSGARGYVYTTGSIPGHAGAFPGRDSGRVLALEALPSTLAGQTDFYVQWGGGEEPIGALPPNHWFQFWVYSPGPPDQNLFTQGKFIYPNRASFYPATLGNEGYVYLMTLGKLSGQTLGLACDLDRSVGCEESYFATKWNGTAGLTNRQPHGGEEFDQNLSSDTPVAAGRWTLIRVHVDVSGTDPRATPGHGVYEQWIRRLGEAEWTKTTEWIGGVTVNPSADSSEPVDMRPAFTDGFRMFRMPTTVGGTNAEIGDWYDYQLYVDDFAIATSEDELPVYP